MSNRPQRLTDPGAEPALLTAQDLLAGSALVHALRVPGELLQPGRAEAPGGEVRIRALAVGTMAVISRAARDEPSLVPLLMLKEALVEPVLSLDELRRLHIGLVHFLVGEVNRVSGLTTEGEAFDATLESPTARAHLLLARHFGWTPEQVAQLTPGQVMVYLSGIERLLAFERRRDDEDAG